MRKLVITQNTTLDGCIEMLDDWFDPQLQDDALLEESHRQDAEADTRPKLRLLGEPKSFPSEIVLLRYGAGDN